MGRLHAEKVASAGSAELPLELVGVADVNAARARATAARVGAPAVRDYRELLPRAEAAIVAVPTAQHYRVVADVLKAGLDALVEKPIAATLGEAEQLLSLARSGQRVLQVGHLEWFNAAIREVRDRVRRPRFVEVHRMGPFTDRSTDIDVVRDLMIHDIDILQKLLGEEPERLEAVGVPVASSEIDIANARLVFPGGCVANLTASRVSPNAVRRLRFFQREAYISVDLLAQSAVVLRRRRSRENGEPNFETEDLAVDGNDALAAQLHSFVRAVRARERPVASGEQALGALRTALRVIEAMPRLDES